MALWPSFQRVNPLIFHDMIPWVSHYCPMIILIEPHEKPSRPLPSPSRHADEATPLRSTPLPSPLPHSMDTMLLCAWPAPCSCWDLSYGKARESQLHWMTMFFFTWENYGIFTWWKTIFLIIQQSLDIPGPCGMRFMTPVAVDPFGATIDV